MCCLRTCGAGVRLETGKSTVAYPVDAKVAKALDEAAEKDAAKGNKRRLLVIGYVANPSDRRKNERK